jgi:hypothetical protein
VQGLFIAMAVAAAGQGHEGEEVLQLADGQQHQVVQVQPGQRFERGARQGGAVRGEAPGRWQHRIGVGLGTDAPQQRRELQARTFAVRAGGVAAVLRQQHPDVHLVGLALQVLEEAADAVPLLLPVALPGRVAFEHPLAVFGAHLRPGQVARDAGVARVLDEVGLALGPGRCLQRLDGAAAQGLLGIGDDQAPVHPDDPAEAAAGRAGPGRRVEREHAGLRRGIAAVAVGAMQAAGEAPQRGLGLGAVRRGLPRFRQGVHGDQAAAALEGHLQRFHHAWAVEVGARGVRPHAEAVNHHVEHQALVLAQGRAGLVLLLAALLGGRFGSGLLLRGGRALGRRHGGHLHHPLGLHAREPAGRQPLAHLLGRGVGRQLGRESHDHAAPALGGRAAAQQLVEHRLRRVFAHQLSRVLVEQLGGAREQQLQVVVELRHRAHGRARGAHGVGLVDGDGRRHAFHAVHGGAVHAVEELARIGREGFYVAPLTLGVQCVEHQRRLARTARPGHDRQLTRVDVEVEVLEVVLAGTANADIGHVSPWADEGRGKHSRDGKAVDGRVGLLTFCNIQVAAPVAEIHPIAG